MEATLKHLIKEAVLEALEEYSNQGIATADEPVKDTTKTDKPLRPGPVIGPTGFSLR